MSEQKIKDCCNKLCTSLNISKKEECYTILQSFFGEKEKTEEKTTGCQSILKSGTNKNQPCGQSVKPGTTFCGRHTPKDTPTEVAPKAITPPKVKKGEIQTNLPVIDKIIQNREMFKVQLNRFNNFVHKETGFVFNPTTKKVIGKQQEDGTVLSLSVTDIELCKENLWDFEIPTRVRSDKPEVVKRKVTVTVENDEEEDDDEEEEEN